MICKKCNAENTGSSQFCSKCGSILEAHSSSKKPEDDRKEGTRNYVLKCESCNAVMDVDLASRVAYCPYCGSKQILKDSDAVEIERLRTDAHKEIELAKLEKQEKTGTGNKTGRTVLIVTAVLLYLASLGELSGNEFSLALINFIQASFFLGAWLVGNKKKKKGKKNRLVTALVIMGLLMFIPFTYYVEQAELTELEWPDNSLSKLLPEPVSNYGYVSSGTSAVLDATMEKVSEEVYNKYLEECKARGFTKVDDSSKGIYEAYSEDGHFLKLFYYKDKAVLYVTLKAPLKFVDLSWPPTELANNIPKPHTLRGVVEKLTSSSFVITIADTDMEAFNNYVMALFNMGYAGDFHNEGSKTLSTSDKKGNYILLKYNVNDTMTIDYLNKE